MRRNLSGIEGNIAEIFQYHAVDPAVGQSFRIFQYPVDNGIQGERVSR